MALSPTIDPRKVITNNFASFTTNAGAECQEATPRLDQLVTQIHEKKPKLLRIRLADSNIDYQDDLDALFKFLDALFAHQPEYFKEICLRGDFSMIPFIQQKYRSFEISLNPESNSATEDPRVEIWTSLYQEKNPNPPKADFDILYYSFGEPFSHQDIPADRKSNYIRYIPKIRLNILFSLASVIQEGLIKAIKLDSNLRANILKEWKQCFNLIKQEISSLKISPKYARFLKMLEDSFASSFNFIKKPELKNTKTQADKPADLILMQDHSPRDRSQVNCSI